MKLGKLLICIVVVSLFVSMALPMVSAKRPPKPPPEEPPADPAIAFVTYASKRFDDRIWVMNADGSNQAVIFEGENYRITDNPSWSPDGNSIAWTGYTFIPKVPGYNFGVWRIDIEIIDGVPQGTNLQQLVSESEDGWISSAAWSPNGDEIAYNHRIYATDTHPTIDKINAVSPSGGTPYNIYTAPEGYALMVTSGLTWSSDGTRLAVIGGDLSNFEESILIIERASGMVTRTLLTGQFDMARPDWARQGSNIIAFQDTSGSRMFYTVDIDTETVVPIREDHNPSWSPDNSKIVYVYTTRKGHHTLYTYEFSTQEITELAEGNTPDWGRF